MTPGGRRIVHVLSGGSFTPVVGWAFEQAAPARNTFVGFGVAEQDIHVPSTAEVVSLPIDANGRSRLDALVAASGIAIFHRVSLHVAPSLAAAPASTLRVWSGWGADYYGTAVDNSAGLLGPETRRLVRKPFRPIHAAYRVGRAIQLRQDLRKTAAATDVFSAPVPEDEAVFRHRFPTFRGRYGQLNYATVEDSVATGARTALGPDILLGNSAAASNNHVDVLRILADRGLEGRKVIVPLSYGDREYAARVAEAGRSLLGSDFIPLTDFLPLEKYNELLSQCGTVIMGHRRQQGIGNLLRAIWQGAAIVLDRRNPVAQHLRANGVAITFLDEVPQSGLPTSSISQAQAMARQQYLDREWSRRAVLRNVENLIASAG
jgi:hypothetical protein